MSDTDYISQEPKPRRSKLAILSLVVPLVVAVLVLLIDTARVRRYPPSPYPLDPLMCILLTACSMIGLAIGIASLVQIRRSRGKLAGKALALSGIILCGLLASGLAYNYWSGYRNAPQRGRSRYLAKLHTLGVALEMYAAMNHNRYPPADKWCDLLLAPVAYLRTDDGLFVYLPTGEGERSCVFAMNPNCEPNSAADTVLLFETQGGWNQYGGPELLTTENHKGKGCHICFNDTYPKFIETDKLGELKWKPEDTNDVN
jgi:4-amino-4-deoxy-L-arabinose transferase-like glycosyltransferase